MSDDTGNAMLLLLMLVLPLSALIARRPNLGQTAKMAAAWIAIFAAGALVFVNRDLFDPALRGVRAAFGGEQRVSGETVRLRMSDDGHFNATVSIDGTERRMLVDSGATTTALSLATARAAGLDLDAAMFPVTIETANGAVTARRATVKRLELGGIVARDLPVVVSEAFGDTDVLGMNFLSRLESWRVEGRTLILTPERS